MYDKIYDNYHILYSTEKSMGNSSGDDNSLDKELHDTKHQLMTLWDQCRIKMKQLYSKYSL